MTKFRHPPHLIQDDADRRAVARMVHASPAGTVWSASAETRSDAQNRLLWAVLGELSEGVELGGLRLTPEQWKHLIVGTLEGLQMVPALDGHGLVPLVRGTSTMSKQQVSDVIELAYKVGAERGHVFKAHRPGGERAAG